VREGEERDKGRGGKGGGIGDEGTEGRDMDEERGVKGAEQEEG
jgi:hypothetical protein